MAENSNKIRIRFYWWSPRKFANEGIYLTAETKEELATIEQLDAWYDPYNQTLRRVTKKAMLKDLAYSRKVNKSGTEQSWIVEGWHSISSSVAFDYLSEFFIQDDEDF